VYLLASLSGVAVHHIQGEVGVLSLPFYAGNREADDFGKPAGEQRGPDRPDLLKPELDPDFQVPATLLFAVHGEDRGEVEAAAERIVGELGRTKRAGRIRQFGNAPDAILSFADFAMAGYSVELLHREEGGMMRDSASVLVAVEMKSGNHIRAFKEEMLARVGEVPLAPGVGIMIVSDQPEATARRIGQFLRCFLEAVVVVVFVASLLMDWRTALVVAVAGYTNAGKTSLVNRICGAGLHAGWRRDGAASHAARLLGAVPAAARLVTLVDGHPATLSWLGAVRGQCVEPLGVESFGQSADLPDLYRTYGLDADAVVAAAARALLR
jgi:hypothetical protein